MHDYVLDCKLQNSIPRSAPTHCMIMISSILSKINRCSQEIGMNLCNIHEKKFVKLNYCVNPYIV